MGWRHLARHACVHASVWVGDHLCMRWHEIQSLLAEPSLYDGPAWRWSLASKQPDELRNITLFPNVSLKDFIEDFTLKEKVMDER